MTVFLETLKFQIVDGELTGSEVTISAAWPEFRVWTSQRIVANRLEKKHRLKVRRFDGLETEVMVPPALADWVLPYFGVRVGRRLSPEQRMEAGKVLAKVRPNGPGLKKSLAKVGTSGV